MTIRFDNRKYLTSHGRNPRGTGCWAFEACEMKPEGQTVFTPRSMSLAEAKKWVRSWCRERGMTDATVFVLP